MFLSLLVNLTVPQKLLILDLVKLVVTCQEKQGLSTSRRKVFSKNA
jgi:hypothetical protein